MAVVATITVDTDNSGKMTFSEALVLLKRGWAVRRDSWNDGWYMRVIDGECYELSDETMGHAEFDEEDIFANDWEIPSLEPGE